MKFTLGWLKQHLDTDASLGEIGEKLTMLGLELESVEDRASRLAPFIVGYVVEARPHPDADRLKVCVVDTGSERTLVTPTVALKLKTTDQTTQVASGLSGNEAFEAVKVFSGAVRFASGRLRYPEQLVVADLAPLATYLRHETDGLLGDRKSVV